MARQAWMAIALLAVAALVGVGVATTAGAQVTSPTPGVLATATPFVFGTSTPGVAGSPLPGIGTSTPVVPGRGVPSVSTTTTPTGVSTPVGTTSAQEPFLLTAALDGAAEVPGPGADGAVGSAAVLVDPSRDMVCYALHIVNVDRPTAAHIHEGAVGVAGPVVVALTPPAPENSNGCVSNVDPSVISRLMQNPANFYVNVHNADFPDGASRGQLGR